jgi:hypothetical protein
MTLNQDELTKELGLSENDNTNQDQSTIEEPSSKFKIGNDEYTQDQINEYVGLAKQVQETEKRYNTKLDRVWPAYGESQNRVKQLETELAEARKPRAEIPQDQEIQIAEAKRAAKQLGILTRDDLAELGIVTKQDFEKEYRLQRATEKLLDDAKDMEKEIDGKDGRPVFRTDEILRYMDENGIRDMEKAYKLRYETELDTWKENKLKEAKRPGMDTMDTKVKPGVSKQPENPKITKANFDSMLQEALEGKL